MRNVFCILLFLMLPQLLWANMASPYREGTQSGAIFTSKQIDIKREKLELNIASDLHTGKYKVQYFIYANKEVKHLPLVFYAMDYLDSFTVWVDNKKITLSEIPNTEIENSESEVHKLLDTVFTENYYLEIDGNYLHYTNLKYFEIQLDSGDHVITVEYISTPGTDRSEWVEAYEYHYSLYPARFWKSFGQLEITIHANFSQFAYKDNLGTPLISNDSVRTYQFFKIPVDRIQLTAIPKINRLAHFLIWISPLGIAFVSLVLVALAHILFLWSFHKNNPNKKARWQVALGSLLAPIFAYIVYMYSFSKIDDVIGEYASRHHGYYFLMIVYYPIVVGVYWPLMAGISTLFKKDNQTRDQYKK